MLVLSVNMRYLRRFRLFFAENQDKNTWRDYLSNLFIPIPLLLCVSLMYTHSIKNITVMAKVTYSSCHATGLGMYLIIYWIMAAQKTTLRNIYSELQLIVHERRLKAKQSAYEFIHESSEKFCTYFPIFIAVTCLICFSIPAISASILYLQGRYSSDVWFHPYPMQLSRNQNCVIHFGYI